MNKVLKLDYGLKYGGNFRSLLQFISKGFIKMGKKEGNGILGIYKKCKEIYTKINYLVVKKNMMTMEIRLENG